MLLWGCVLDLVVRSKMRVDVSVDYFVFICDFGLDALLVLVLAGLVWLVGSCAFWVCLNTICCCLADCGFELGVVIAVSLGDGGVLFGVELFAICGFCRLLLGFSGWCGRFVGVVVLDLLSVWVSGFWWFLVFGC